MSDRLAVSYYVPSRLRKIPDSQKLYTPTPNDVTFYLDFSGFLPGTVIISYAIVELILKIYIFSTSMFSRIEMLSDTAIAI